MTDDDETTRYRLDPKKPRQLTPEEQERLDKARIDYSDIPPLGDEFFSQAKPAALPMMNCTWEGCTTTTEGMEPIDGWGWFIDWPRIKDGWYCPAHAPLLNHLVEQAQTEGTAPPPHGGYPPLFGEDWIAALLLAMLIEHCTGCSPEKRRRMTSYLMPDPSPGEWLDSYNIPANAEAMRELDGSEIEITEQDGAHIIAKVTPQGRALLDRLRAERERRAKP